MTDVTRAAQREATRRAMLDAAVTLVCAEGLAAVTTRRVARVVNVSQSAVMYHFSTRQALHAAAVAQLAEGIEREARASVQGAAGRAGLRLGTDVGARVADLRDPRALAVAQLWMAAGAEPAYVRTVRDPELMIVELGPESVRPISHRFEDEAAVFAFVDSVFSVIRGLIISVPVWGMAAIEARWQGSKQILLRLVPPDHAGLAGRDPGSQPHCAASEGADVIRAIQPEWASAH
ncbi:TetR/AcrR family transcriptional regulator [Nocardioides sp. B-3]|uniref:TetR/AcrR family transcriptional regulator n=1 Tax=Nocardioides sp. B-3 TaxID=2895565 RepID=UPI00215327E7|nr:TetR/AcrR family transcriptional regulator [Nocardioides sp. B-3]UUZ58253.1 TetR/AcrR family transcriptional regulator [Nocardioides sp. B-3]